MDEIGAGIRELDRERNGVKSVAAHFDIGAVVRTVGSSHRHKRAVDVVTAVIFLDFVLNRQIGNPVAGAVAEAVLQCGNVQFEVAVIVFCFISTGHIDWLKIHCVEIQEFFLHAGEDFNLGETRILTVVTALLSGVCGGIVAAASREAESEHHKCEHQRKNLSDIFHCVTSKIKDILSIITESDLRDPLRYYLFIVLQERYPAEFSLILIPFGSS